MGHTKRNRIRLLGYLADYFSYNRAEQRGILILCIILFAVVLAQVVIPAETFRDPVDFSSINKEVETFEISWKKAEDSLARIRAGKVSNRFKYSLLGHRDTIGNLHSFRNERNAFTIELNTADTFDLQRLSGIGPAFARRIVTYRSRLGGFYKKEQVLEVYGMDTSRYRAIQGHLSVNEDSVHPLDLNHITFKELLRHPYFPFGITKAIMLYRQKNKVFKSIDELKGIDGVTDSVYQKISRYLLVKP